MAGTRRRDYYFQSLKRMSDSLANEDWSKFTVELGNVRLEQLESMWVNLEILHLALLEKNDLSAADENYMLLDDARRMYANCKATFHRKISEMRSAVAVAPRTSVTPTQSDPTELTSVNGANIELLNQIGKFKGDFAKWSEFRNGFVAKVHTNAAIPNAQKLIMLTRVITGSAAHVLGKWQLIDANYELAWNKLCGVYNNQYLIARAHIQSLQTMPRLESATFERIFDLIDRVMYAQRQLSAMGVPADKWDLMIIYLVEERLDEHSRDAWIDYRENNGIDLPNWDEMLKFLQRRAVVLPVMNSPIASSTILPPTDLPGLETPSSIANHAPLQVVQKQLEPKNERNGTTAVKRKPSVPPEGQSASKKLLNVPENGRKMSFQLRVKPMSELTGPPRRNTISVEKSSLEINKNHCIVCSDNKHARFVDCQECSARGHFTCLRRQKLIRNADEERGWKCPKCLRCATCNSTQKLGVLFKCRTCKKRYHSNCQKKQPRNALDFKCDNCNRSVSQSPNENCAPDNTHQQ